MRYFTILLLTVFFVSCKDQMVVISEQELKDDQYFYKEDYKPFSGTCRVNYTNQKAIKLESSYEQGILNGQTVLYFEDGNPKRKGSYFKGKCNGLWEGWFNNGNKEFEIHYKEGKLCGKYITYHRNGKIKEKGEYINNSKVNEWICYNENGMEVSRKIY